MKDMQHEFVAKTKIVTLVGGIAHGKTREVPRRTMAICVPRLDIHRGGYDSVTYSDTGKRDAYGFAVFEIIKPA